MVNTFYDSYRILMKIYGEKAYIKQAISSEVIEPINKNTVIKICYGVVERDITLEYYLSKFCDKRPKLPIRVLLKIALYNIIYMQKAPYAVTDSAVELCKKLGKGGASGFLNAVLRKYIKNPQIQLPENKLYNYSVRFSYPQFAVELLVKYYGEKTAEQIMQYGEVNTFLRFAKGIDGNHYLCSIGKPFEKTPFENTFMFKNFQRDEGFFTGKYTFQSIGSVAICNVVEGGENLLDCCAAPGGKSVYLAERFTNVTACELHPHRARLILDYAERMGATNVEVRCEDATCFNQEYSGKFDAVLCDCPCSGFGVVGDNPDIKLNREIQNVHELAELQLKILQNASKYVKSGGCLYYSTCSVFNCENDEIIEKFLKLNNDYKPQKINSALAHLDSEFGLQFLPHLSLGAGFYVCKLRKL
ncbi:MAG: hypothetical protein IJW13_05630 [Clostridia bacterium]|nr:hypothetical protein [Clostridia bacterium]